MKQSKKHHKSSSMLINFEKHHESSFKQFQLTSIQNSSSSSISVENKLAWQIDDLISTLINKLIIVMLETNRQYSCCIKGTDLKTKCLIWVLLLQAITQLKIRLTADNLVSYRKTFNNLNQKTVFSDIFISKFILYNSLNSSKKNTTILSLIKNIQEFNLQCKQISSQLHKKSEENLSFVLYRNEILKKINHVYISHQETIQNQFLELYHNYFNKNYWNRNKILKLVQYYFIWNRIANNIHIYIVTYLICQNKAIHDYQFYDQLKSFFISKNTWNLLFKKLI